MYQLAKTLLIVTIFCGDLSSRTLGQAVEPSSTGLDSKAPKHNTKPGSLHRKSRNTGSSRSKGQKNRANSRGAPGSIKTLNSVESPLGSENQTDSSSDRISNQNQTLAQNQTADNSLTNATSVNGSTSQPTAGDQAENSENDAIPGNPDTKNYNGSAQDFTSSRLQNSSSNVNGSQFDDPKANLSNSDSNQNQTLNSTSGAGSSGSLISELPQSALQKGNIFLGFLPDDGSSGGNRQTMAQLNSQIGQKSAVYGWYAQAHAGIPFDGSQLLAVIDDVKASKCVFQPAVMPIGGWKGLTSSDNSQAIAIANVMKKFTDEGIPVWLRFAHEVNYYQTDGTYQGTASDFKAGWAAVAAAVKKIAPSVKMWWTPNVSSAEDYAAYEPDDMSTVDLVGIDYYPKTLKGNDFLEAMKEFHDKYAVNGRKFAIGETGLGWSGTINDKTQWFNEICESKSALPEFVAMAWFNFVKEYDYKIAGEPTLNQKFTALFTN